MERGVVEHFQYFGVREGTRDNDIKGARNFAYFTVFF